MVRIPSLRDERHTRAHQCADGDYSADAPRVTDDGWLKPQRARRQSACGNKVLARAIRYKWT
jgi:hypothetical protein